MNTEKIEKLKKGLTNSQIPETLREKIREQIKKMEAEDLKSSAPKSVEISKQEKIIEKEIEKEIVKAKEEEKEEAKELEKAKEVEKKEPVAKEKVTRTKKPTTEGGTKKPTAMALAKEIRKDGESWKEAMKRASVQMKKGTTETKKAIVETKKSTITEMQKLLKFVKRRKELKGITGTNLQRDASRSAKPRGVRKVTHSGETSNQYGTYDNHVGRKYTENRDEHSDRLAPKYPKGAPKLNNGGMLNSYNVIYLTKNGKLLVAKNVMATNEEQAEAKLKKEMRASNTFDKVVSVVRKSFATGGLMDIDNGAGYMNQVYAGGGSIKNQYEGRTAMNIWDNWTTKQKRHFLIDHYLTNTDYNLEETEYIERIKLLKYDELPYNVVKDLNHHRAMGQYADGGDFMSGAYADEGAEIDNWEKYQIQDKNGYVSYFDDKNYAEKFLKENEGSTIVRWDDDDKAIYTRNKDGIKVKSIAMPEKELTESEWLAKHNESPEARNYAVGGGIFADTFTGETGTHYTGLVGETNAMSSGEMFEDGGAIANQQLIADAHLRPAEMFGREGIPAYARGGGLRNYNGREYSTGRNWTNDHRHENKEEDYEVPMYSRKK